MLTLKRVERPRELKWYQAGAMLYGDWGTSKAYVLGIAFALSGHASWLFLGIMSLLTAFVGYCYTLVCRIYPDGGGVYSSVKHRNQTLAVIGALLLIADYVVTASLSALDAFHYFNFPHPERWAIISILVIGAVNWIGPTKGASVAAVIAVAASAIAAVLFISTLPSLPHVELARPSPNWAANWSVFVGIILALSGVEAVANMTGIMVKPVEKTAKRAIWPVLLEVSVLTFLLGIAMNAIPGLERDSHTEDMLRALGNHYIGPWYGHIISLVFGLLLLSAVNTAISDLVSIQFSMAKDRELPRIFSSFNRFGMPWLSLIVAMAAPIMVLLVEHDLVRLASFYAIGVVGAITLNLGSCATNFELALKKRERGMLFICAGILAFVWITIAIQKHNALMFAVTVIGSGLALRFIAKKVAPLPIPEELLAVNVLSLSEAKEIVPLYNSSSLVALKGLNLNLLEEAALRTKALGENAVYLTYVEESPPSMDLPTELEPSAQSIELLGKAQKEMEAKGVTAVPIWRMGENPGKLIADTARELGIKTVMIGTTKRSALINLLRGDVLRNLAKNLPPSTRLVISG